MIRVLVVEDSPVVREFLLHVLSADPSIQIAGTARDGQEAIEAVQRLKPDLITMDIHMPNMDGLEATRQIMSSYPTPIVIVSGSSNSKEIATSFHAIEAGAVAFVNRPKGIGHPESEAMVAELIRMIKAMSEVKVVRRRVRSVIAQQSVEDSPRRHATPEDCPRDFELIAVGASTGGPIALQTILSRLPATCAVPIVVVQHMAVGFIQGFAEWLSQSCPLPVCVAATNERILSGHVYIAPDGLQMGLKTEGTIWLAAAEPENGHRPSVSYLFRSVAQVYGPRAIGVLLTGMGKDGAEELKMMKDQGAATIAQDEESSVVHGMPGEAIRLGAATYVLSPEMVPGVLLNLVNRDRRQTVLELDRSARITRTIQ